MTVLPLAGPTPDNLLSHLALCGALLALDTARPDWRPRLSWRGPPWRAFLHLDAEADKAVVADAVADAVDEGVRRLGVAYAFDGRKNIDFSPGEFRSWAEARALTPDTRTAADLAAVLASDACGRGAKGEKVEATPLCALFGQGHQHFLERLEALAARPQPQASRQIAGALFSPWVYAEEGLTFRWDSREDRRYALGHGDPSKERVLTVPGANRLATVGLLFHPSAPGPGRLRGTGFSHHKDETTGRRRPEITWPVWTIPVGADALRLLLAHPALTLARPQPGQLRPHGVAEVFRARRLQVGKYFSFTAGRPLWG